ncbi:MAG TPA: cadherin-like domain-containing protein [Acidimicrobiia bacterium]|nr:cadherin-like domain-containing protein [Acidimicrobiia bacterium]
MRRFFRRAAHGGRRVGLTLAVALLAGLTSIAASVPSAPSASAVSTSGYWLVGTDGGIFSYGRAGFFGSTGAIPLNQPIVGMAATPDSRGYWMVASDGGIFAFGNAPFYGSMGGKPLNQPIVAIAATRTGKGYWMVASDGGIFAFGDAPFFGSMGAARLNKPIVDIVPTPSGRGYWMAASDGGIFAFGDAGFFGSTGAIKLAKRIQQMASTPTGKGYWMVAGDGGVFSFGDAGFFGSAADGSAEKRIVDIAPSATGKGYYMTASNGAVFAYGDAKYYGGLEGQKLSHGIISMVALNNGEPPVAGDDTINLDEDGLGSVDVLANDHDPDGGPLLIQGLSQPGRGGSVTASGGSITYHPAPDMNGSDSFTYTLVDDRGNTAIGRVSVNVKSIDDLPRTTDDAITGLEDNPFGIDVLANDSGLGDGIGSLTIVTQPHLGTATIVGGRILYTPKPNLNGSDSLRYRLIDGDGDNAEGGVKITLVGTNDLPVAVDVGSVNCTSTSCDANVLNVPGASGGDTDKPQIRLVNEDQNKQVFVDGVGTFTRKSNTIVFKPVNNGVPGGSVQFEIGDDNNGQGGFGTEWSDPATVTFHFQNNPPTADPNGHFEWLSNTASDGQLVGTDPDSDPLTYNVVSIVNQDPNNPTPPAITWQPNGVIHTDGLPAGTYIVTFKVSDGPSESGTVNCVVIVSDPSTA